MPIFTVISVGPSADNTHDVMATADPDVAQAALRALKDAIAREERRSAPAPTVATEASGRPSR